MTTVYLAGGINGLSDADATDWRTQAKSLIPDPTLDPMARDYRGREDENVKAIVEGDLSDIEACDVVLAYCQRPSWGTAMEIHHAAAIGRRVVAVVPKGPVSPWLRYHADAVVTSIEQAVDVIAGWEQ